MRSGCKQLEKIFIIEIGDTPGDLSNALNYYDCYVASIMQPLIERIFRLDNTYKEYPIIDAINMTNAKIGANINQYNFDFFFSIS